MKYENIVEVGNTLSVLALASFLTLLLAGGLFPLVLWGVFTLASVLWIAVFKL